MIAVKYNNYFDGNQNKHKILRLKRKKPFDRGTNPTDRLG